MTSSHPMSKFFLQDKSGFLLRTDTFFSLRFPAFSVQGKTKTPAVATTNTDTAPTGFGAGRTRFYGGIPNARPGYGICYSSAAGG